MIFFFFFLKSDRVGSAAVCVYMLIEERKSRTLLLLALSLSFSSSSSSSSLSLSLSCPSVLSSRER